MFYKLAIPSLAFAFATLLVSSHHAALADPLPPAWQKKREAGNRIIERACKGEKRAISQVWAGVNAREPVLLSGIHWLKDNCRPFKHLTNTEVNRYLRLSADAGYPIAMRNYGLLLLYASHGVRRDVSRGVKLLEEAARKGYGIAEADLAWDYSKGKNLQRDLNMARRFRDIAQSEGVQNGIMNALSRSIAKAQAAERRPGAAPPPRRVVRMISRSGASTKSSRPTLVDLRKYGPRAPKASARVQADFKNWLREAVR
jgi:hypothetical protein